MPERKKTGAAGWVLAGGLAFVCVVVLAWLGRPSGRSSQVPGSDQSSPVGPVGASPTRPPTHNPPLRLTYFTIEGHAIDFLIRGGIDPQWEKRLAGQPFIVPNDVLADLRSMVSSFSKPLALEGGYFKLRGDQGRDLDFPVGAAENQQSFFVGSIDQRGYGEQSEDTEPLPFEESGKPPWHALVGEGVLDSPLSEQPNSALESITFWRFIDREDLQRFRTHIPHDRALRFLEHVSRENFPPDFGILWHSYESCGDGSMGSNLDPRLLKLRVAVLENSTPNAIRIGNFTVKKNHGTELRTREEEQRALSHAPAESELLFPQEMLLPRETLLIPVEMVMGWGEQPKLQYDTAPAMKERIWHELSRVKSLQLQYLNLLTDSERQLTLPITTLREMSSFHAPDVTKEYLTGPSVLLESVEIDQEIYPLRRYEEGRLVLLANSEAGSCPYLYTYSNASWQREGHILYGFRSESREAADSVDLQSFDGRVLLTEEEPEVSFVNWLVVHAVAADGSERILLPVQPKLRARDGDYLVLRRGDRVEIRFEGEVRAGERYHAVAAGYYVPQGPLRRGLR